MTSGAYVKSPAGPAYPDAGVDTLCACVWPVETERVSWTQEAGRVLAEPVIQ